MCIAVLTLGAALAIVRKVDEHFRRKKNGGKDETDSTHEPDREVYDNLKPAPRGSLSIPQPSRLSAEVRPAAVQET